MIGIQAKPRVAILGAGIMGSSAALLLARAGCRVTLIDQTASAMTGASRWNEGKIHLGFLYAGDPSCRTAAELLIGGLAFRPLTEDLIGRSLVSATTPDDDLYLVHPESVVDALLWQRTFSVLRL
jgi:glycine/D-amino acid oxidase-like deaminating enzyme